MVISLTTTPMMCAHLLKAHEEEKHGRLYRWSERFFNFILGRYTHSLRWVLDNPCLVLTVLVLVIALNVVIIVHVPKGFFPQQDTGAIVGGVQGPQDASFPLMENSILQLVDVIKADPAVDHVNAFTRVVDNGGFIYIAFKPLKERKDRCGDDYQSTAPEAEPVAGGAGIFTGGAGYSDRRQGERGAVSIHDSGRQRGRPEYVGADSARQYEEAAGAAGCEFRPAKWRVADLSDL